MAVKTSKSLRNQVMYSIYVRNHTAEGTFAAIEPDLERIKALGTDIIWFMPIHPIGEKNKKGSLGCPYANRDYRAVNPEYGTMEEFKHLVNEIHKLGMKCIIDVVYNHTSPDSVLVAEHPEYFFKKPDGSFGNRVGDWTDVVDLDYSCKELWEYQIESLKMWAEIVDGFRCDVAPLVPLSFWKMARESVEEIRPGAIWLAETIHAGFLTYLRSRGMEAYSDGEIYQVFDMEYPYEIWDSYIDYMNGKGNIARIVEDLNREESAFPDNYIKIRCLENHDQPRVCSNISSMEELRNLTAFSYFQKGMAFIYAGQEYQNTNCPSLFEKDVITRDENKNISVFLAKLADIKRKEIFASGVFSAKAFEKENVIVAKYVDGDISMNDNIKAYGIFAMRGSEAYNKGITLACELPDGQYVNAIDDSDIFVRGGKVIVGREPMIIIVGEAESDENTE